MNKIVKILLTVVLLIVATPFFEIAKQTPVLKLVLLAGLVGALVAIWKKPKEESSENNDDKHQLDKS